MFPNGIRKNQAIEIQTRHVVVQLTETSKLVHLDADQCEAKVGGTAKTLIENEPDLCQLPTLSFVVDTISGDAFRAHAYPPTLSVVKCARPTRISRTVSKLGDEGFKIPRESLSSHLAAATVC